MCFSATEITVPFTLRLGSSAIQRDIIRHCLDYLDGGEKFEKSLDKDLSKFICEGTIENLQGKPWRFKPDASYSFHVNSLIFLSLDLIKFFSFD